ncbi:MAG: hypothetical protein OEW06_07930, partial [Gemmatimonadota bacterium]|nr:hypothetical protein [Gemmatimonadota bacterium]
MQIEVDDNGECTLTVNAFMPESEAWGFITASHCTSEFGGAYGEAAYKNTEGYGKVIGWEILDMELFPTGTQTCPSSAGRLGCRYTDAAFFVYQSNSYPDSMTIARTT